MEYKPDFEQIVPRMEAWWQGELLDRACIAVSAPSGRNVPGPGPAQSLQQQWLDFDWVIEQYEAGIQNTYYAGEAVPVFRVNLGPDLFSALLGGTIQYRETTSWVAPFLDWDDPVSFQLNKESFEWNWHLKMYRRLQERSRDRYLVMAPDCHSGGDALLSMRGGSALCMDLYDRPDQIKDAMARLEKAVGEFHEGFWEPIEANGQPGHASSWLRTWSPGRSNVIQLDLLALISPQMFEEFFYNELLVQCSVLDNTIFHLDGPDAIKHLPKLYELPANCPAIQWVYGAGNGPMSRWIPLLKEIQANGRGLHLSCGADEVETLLTELSAKGLYLATHAESREEADELVKLVGRLSHE